MKMYVACSIIIEYLIEIVTRAYNMYFVLDSLKFMHTHITQRILRDFNTK